MYARPQTKVASIKIAHGKAERSLDGILQNNWQQKDRMTRFFYISKTIKSLTVEGSGTK